MGLRNGQIVNFFPAKDDEECRSNHSIEVPAIITADFDDRVNLRVFVDGDDGPFWRTSIEEIGDNTAGQDQPYWSHYQ